MSENSNNERGNLGAFLLGIILLGVGIFMVFNNTTISTQFNLFGYTPSLGVMLIPILLGIVLLCINSKLKIGWILIGVGVAIIILGILMGLRLYFHRIGLIEGLIMFGTIAVGMGYTLKGVLGK